MANLQVFPNYSIHHVPEINSTNRYAEDLLAKNKLPEGSLIVTDNQTAGIGQADNKWESEPFRNLTVTVILYPDFLGAAYQFYLSIIMSLAVCKTVNYYLKAPVAMIKWPNDIYCNHRKIAGMLIKNHIMGASISQSIAGLGLNINQMDFKQAPQATSLKLLTGLDFNVHEVMTKWHNYLADYYLLLKQSNEPHTESLKGIVKGGLKEQYLSQLYLKDQPADFIINGNPTRATITGVDHHGQLILIDENHTKHICGLKEIVFP